MNHARIARKGLRKRRSAIASLPLFAFGRETSCPNLMCFDLVGCPAWHRLSKLIEDLILTSTLLAAPGGDVRSAQFIVNKRIFGVQFRRHLQVIHRLLDVGLLE